ncbi:MAG: hypothetical protein M1462_04460 [Candidatus Thermoplasmatota archaeon]|jgi:hypothetical protein|uniref:hypothetical protein n=1 Tax=Ferroplasma sp. TaxID=2591003 RepID=UPI00260C69B4|nr:hypothetical protein [Ferroplasma sp.]MCL4311661.1 hypothetical protein [Candidatus Thermoplasmatota archaeon]
MIPEIIRPYSNYNLSLAFILHLAKGEFPLVNDKKSKFPIVLIISISIVTRAVLPEIVAHSYFLYEMSE